MHTAKVLSVLVVMCSLASAAALTEELKQEMQRASADEQISCLVYMKAGYPYEEIEKLAVPERIATLRRIAAESQAAVVDFLASCADEASVRQQFWVMNGLHITATARVISELAQRDDVAWISHDGEVRIIGELSPSTTATDAVEWNIRKIMADSCWNAGYTGAGVIIGLTDTGVDYTHPALEGKWSGYWKVASGLPPSSTPYDDHNHGTHCMGTILGGDGLGPFADDIGVAPGAKYAAAKVLNSGGSGSFSQCIEGLQFMADIKESVDVKAVSNSWGSNTRTDTSIWPVCRTLRALGILPIFANGNAGPNPATAGVPGNYSVVVGVGATDSQDLVASFSSRGPAPEQSPWTDQSQWYRPDWQFVKPNISAPGAGIRSCVRGGYATWNGTSMATPHVAGAVAILCQKNRNLRPQILYNLLLDNSDQPAAGVPYPNNNYGWGRLNVWKALQATAAGNTPYLVLWSRQLSDSPPGGNGNGLFEPGETVSLVISLFNAGADCRNATAVLRSRDNYIRVLDDSSFFGNIARNGQANNASAPYRFRAHALTPPGRKVLLELIISAEGDSGNFQGRAEFLLSVGNPPSPYVIWEDDFEYGGGIDSLLHYWTVSANWARSTERSVSPDHSIYNRNAKGVYEIRLKTGPDLRLFAEPRLNFWHSYRFSQPIWHKAYAEISTNNGTNWTSLWSYAWVSDPESIPWTERSFSLAPYRAENVIIRFRADVGSFSTAARWFIDDVRFTVAPDNAPPDFASTTRWRDTVFTGPFPVSSRVSDQSGIDSVRLYYRVNQGTWTALEMVNIGGGTYAATIPAQQLNDRIDYYLWARDKWPPAPNTGTDPVGAPTDGMYTFYITATGTKQGATQPEHTYGPLLRPNPARGWPEIALDVPTLQPVRLEVYDLTGRLVKTVFSQPAERGHLRLVWNRRDEDGRCVAAGVYFVRFESENSCGLAKLVLLD